MDVAVLGALQVSEKGDLAGWNNPERGFPEHIGNIGGSMDLAVGARKVIAAMEHVTTKGDFKIVKKCTYPVTAVGVVKMIVTDLGRHGSHRQGPGAEGGRARSHCRERAVSDRGRN